MTKALLGLKYITNSPMNVFLLKQKGWLEDNGLTIESMPELYPQEKKNSMLENHKQTGQRRPESPW